MAGVPLHSPQRLSVGQFREFIEGRPDKERWELIDGVAMVMATPTSIVARRSCRASPGRADPYRRRGPAAYPSQACQ